MTGHTVIAFPVPELDGWVRERTEHYDASYVSTDPGFVHAHITVLGPWVCDPTAVDLERVAELVEEVEPFDVTLGAVHAFPDGLIHLRPVPEDPIRDLTARLWQAFPDHPPYAGAYADPTPHLTLDQTALVSTAVWTRNASWEQEAAEHRAILDAIRAGRADVAATLLEEHIRAFVERNFGSATNPA